MAFPATFLLHEPEQPTSHVYFPTSGVVSIVAVTAGEGVEAGLIGREGMVGVSVLLGCDRTITRAIVQIAGDGFRMKTEDFRQLVRPGSTLYGRLLRYAHYFLCQSRNRSRARPGILWKSGCVAGYSCCTTVLVLVRFG